MSFNKLWKYSKLRFYYLNAIWNYKFWIFSKKIYQNKSYQVDDNSDFYMGVDFKLVPKKKTINTRRFIGYMYDGKLYLDNPGLPNVQRDVWEQWKNKGLLK